MSVQVGKPVLDLEVRRTHSCQHLCASQAGDKLPGFPSPELNTTVAASLFSAEWDESDQKRRESVARNQPRWFRYFLWTLVQCTRWMSVFSSRKFVLAPPPIPPSLSPSFAAPWMAPENPHFVCIRALEPQIHLLDFRRRGKKRERKKKSEYCSLYL